MKQPLNFNFSHGLDLKTDPKQVPAGKFLRLENIIFDQGGLLQKRNGFSQFTILPDTSARYLTTLNNNLTAIGNTVSSYASASNQWVTRGAVSPLTLSTLNLVRSSTNQSQVDTAMSASGFTCVVWTDQNPSNPSTPQYKYSVVASKTGQNIVLPTPIPAASSGVVTGAPRVFTLGNYFIILFNNVITATSHLQYIAININNPTIVTAPVDIAGAVTPSTGLNFDAYVVNSALYIAYNTVSGGQALDIKSLSSTLIQSGVITVASSKATLMSVTADISNSANPVIYMVWYDSSSTNGFAIGFNASLAIVMTSKQIITSQNVSNITSVANNNVLDVYYEVSNPYGFDSTILSNFINHVSVTYPAGTISSTVNLVKSVGLASKAVMCSGATYFLASYNSVYQPGYYLINASTSLSSAPTISAKLAYQNGGGYLTTGLPNMSVSGSALTVPYLFKDLITSVNKSTNVPSGVQTAGIFSQTGVNSATITLGTQNYDTAEAANTLHMSGGFLWMYDGLLPVEHNFFVYPDNVEATPSNSGGSMSSQQYYYQAVYQWTDNQGNIHNSAPSIPILMDMSSTNPAFTAPTAITTTAAFSRGAFTMTVASATGLRVGQVITDTTTPASIQATTMITKISGTTITVNLPFTAASTTDTISTVTINSATISIPTLRLTYKTATPVQIILYRWSTAQESYFQVTSLAQPLINTLSADYVTFTDTLADSSILGNALIYTTGNVVEDVGAPSTNLMTLWQSRLFLVDAEDQNTIWYSKQVIENTPVEMSDLFTIYVTPTSNVSTGPITAISAIDSNLIVFKKDTIYYISGAGPDTTGANNLFTDPQGVTSVVGCKNQNSIVNIPTGILFQSDKGIWLLDRSLQTSYLGAPVEQLTLGANVLSAILVPGTNQVRFTLDSNITIVYDYYYNEWSTFNGIPNTFSTLYKNLHSFVNSFGQVFQETPGLYLDGSNPVLISFTTGWLNIAGNQGYQRIHEFNILGNYFTPHILNIGVGYDYQSPTQQTLIQPTNYSPPFGADQLFGQSSPFGGANNLEQWRIFTQTQKCQVFQINLDEVFDPTYATIPGAGFTLSGVNCVVSAKSSYRPIKGSQSAG